MADPTHPVTRDDVPHEISGTTIKDNSCSSGCASSPVPSTIALDLLSRTAHPEQLRWLIRLSGLLSCLVGGVYVPIPWIRVTLLVVAACIGLAMLVEFITSVLYSLVDKQRWKYRLWDPTGKTVYVPNPDIQGEDVKRVFGHADINVKSSNGLRQLIRWWHAPCSDCHQEIMERNDLYGHVRRITTRILSMPIEDARRLARKHLDEAMLRQHSQAPAWSITKLRAVVFPIAVSFCYEWVLKRECPPEIVSLLAASTGDVVAATGAMKGRDMPLRMKALGHIKSVLEEGGGRPDIFGDDCSLTIEQRAQYLLGVWIHSATAQMARFTCNTICYLSRNPRCLEIVKREIGQEGSYMDAVLLETLRLAPGIPAVNRAASKDVTINENLSFQSGANFVFDLERYHLTGFDSPDEFMPERWFDGQKKELKSFIPFGVGKQRCPAERFAMVIVKDMVLHIVTSIDIHLPVGFGVLFSTKPRIANDLCCVVRRPPISRLKLFVIGCYLSSILMVENVWKSFIQLAVMPKNAMDAFHEDTLT